MESVAIVGCGALNWDCLFKVREIVVDGESIIEDEHESPGGSAANTIYALARWGVKTGFIGAVGDDNEGQMILQEFESVGVETHRIRVIKGQRTGRVIGIVDIKGRRSLYVQPGANLALRLTEDDFAYVAKAQWVHISSLIGTEVFEGVRTLILSLPHDVSVCFAPGAIYSRLGLKALESILKRTNILFLARDELATLMGTENLDAATQRLWELGVETIVVTLGESGSWVGSKGKGQFAPSHQAHVVDTTGAGDAFAAGFLWGVLNGRPMPECQRLGTIAAAFCLREMGARTGTPTVEELLAIAFG